MASSLTSKKTDDSKARIVGERVDITLGQDQLTKLQWREVVNRVQLSARELATCQALFDGLTRKEIALKLTIGERTVRQYMENIHHKLKVSNRVSVVLRIIQIRDSIDKDWS